jgi:hypothetical protein
MFHGQNVLPYVGKGKNDQTIGLLGSLVYDIPEDNNVTGILTVRGTQFAVSCGTLVGTLNASYVDEERYMQFAWGSSALSDGTNGPTVSFEIPIGGEFFSYCQSHSNFPLIAKDSLALQTLEHLVHLGGNASNFLFDNRSSIVIASTTPIVDGNGNQGPHVLNLSRPLSCKQPQLVAVVLLTYSDNLGPYGNETQINDNTNTYENITISTLYVAVCHLELQELNVVVDPQSKRVIKDPTLSPLPTTFSDISDVSDDNSNATLSQMV